MPASRRVIDLVPERYLTLALLFAAGLLIVAGLEWLYWLMPRLAAHTTDGRIMAFDLDSEGSLGSWFSSTLLLVTSAVAWLVFSVRRHRPDDYHGRYRVWRWAAACWLLMSIDEASSLHEGFKELMSQLTGQRLMGDGSLWWILAYGVVLGAIGIRMLLDMRVCRAATTALVLAGAAYGVAVAAQVEWLLPHAGARGVMLEEGCEMFGNLLALLSMSLMARHVILESKGRLTARPARVKKSAKKVEGAEPAKKEPQSVGAAKGSSSSGVPSSDRSSRSGEPATATAAISRSGLRIDPPETPLKRHGLSKAERKAMRRAQRSYDDEEE